MDPSRVQDRKPVHAGVAILQHSKLMLLHFVDFLRKYLVKGSYALVYGGKILHQIILYLIVIFLDTDSLTLSVTKSEKVVGKTRLEQMEKIFLPIVKEELFSEFKQVWGNWLVLSNDIRDEKCPGKLKTEFFTQNGEMIALAPKSYYAKCFDTDQVKDGRKGIPKWVDLKLDAFYDTLYNEENVRHKAEVRSLRLNKDKKMTRTTMIKAGLTAIHVKLRVKDDKVSCEPLKLGENFV